MNRRGETYIICISSFPFALQQQLLLLTIRCSPTPSCGAAGFQDPSASLFRMLSLRHGSLTKVVVFSYRQRTPSLTMLALDALRTVQRQSVPVYPVGSLRCQCTSICPWFTPDNATLMPFPHQMVNVAVQAKGSDTRGPAFPRPGLLK